MKWMLIIAIVMLFIYEIWSLKNEKPDDTITAIVKKFSRKPLLPFAFGMLMGHFFW
jgi:hypothetical protein